jgi:hypothetical protein
VGEGQEEEEELKEAQRRLDRSRGTLALGEEKPNYSLLRVKKSKIVNRMRKAITMILRILITAHMGSKV